MSPEVVSIFESLPMGQEQLLLLQRVIDQHSIVSITDVQGHITYVNDQFCRISGYRRDELLGHNHRIVKSAAHEPSFYAQMWDTISRGEVWHGVVENRNKSGESYWVKTTIMPVLDGEGLPRGYLSVRTDISPQMRARRTLARFKNILDQTLDSVYIFDAKTLQFTYVNQGAMKQVGYLERELLSMTPVDLRSDICEMSCRDTLQPLLDGDIESRTFETEYVHKSGAKVPVETFLQYFADAEGGGQFIAIVRDIRERRRIVGALESLSVVDPTSKVFSGIAESVATALGVRWVGMARLNENGNCMELMGYWENGQTAEEFEFELLGDPAASVLARGEPLTVVEGISTRFPQSELLRRMGGAASYHGRPLQNSNGHKLGVFFVVDDKPWEATPTNEALLKVATKRASLELHRLSIEKSLASRTKQFVDTFDRVSDSFFSLDAHWQFTFVNASAAELMQSEWYELLGKSAWDSQLVDCDFIQRAIREAKVTQQSVSAEGFYPVQNRWLALRVYPSTEGVSVYIQDVTEHKLAEEEHRQIEEQMQRAQKMQAIGQLTAGVSHDFNNILASIMGYTDLALSKCTGKEPEKMREYLTMVFQASERARDLIAQMLTFSRGEETDAHWMEPLPLVKETVKLLRSTLPANISLSLHCPDEELPLIAIEPVKLQQVVMNLCINARDAMRDEGHIRIGLRKVWVNHRECDSCHEKVAGHYIVLQVEDDGEGISPEAMEHLFEPFFTTKDLGEGSGLGLSMVHGIVHENQGHIHVDSTLGQGAAIRLLFPVKEVVLEDIARHAGQLLAAENTGRDAEQKHILLVDDEQPIIDFVTIWLRDAGYKVTAFIDSQEALASFVQNPEAIDLLITDQIMPGIQGMEMAGRMRALKPDLPVLMCSGHAGMVNNAELQAAGVRYFLAKPMDKAQLLDLVEQVLYSMADK
jgi:PAS domain S-box-containing protein